MREIELGSADRYSRFPAEVVIERKAYYLLREEDRYELMSRRCPHAGDTVELEDGELVCPMHGWTFELHTGRCHNVPSAKLNTYEVQVKDGMLVALLP
ncbi:Rieske (2Fe-2S) protein [Gorillibacterium sp. sgz5001074]|uniref:Rieske (2Fe-2S) protein n=1 Tax=Gorillibacterium sp. sgz5001074 TaxID=3446695 RepID=UPI003F6665A6